MKVKKAGFGTVTKRRGKLAVRANLIRDSERVAKELGKAFRRYGTKVGLPDWALKSIYTGE